jgi:ectoine hydroxylase-related dioxygenase (phytanoyl-CoA dioxygenase family)
MSERNADDLRSQFSRDGFTTQESLVPADLLERVTEHMDAVTAGDYETGRTPNHHRIKPDDATEIIKIDNAHLSDHTLMELVSYPALGAFAATVMDAAMVQVWAVQLLIKPPGGTPSGHVGWHQDFQYWHSKWEPDSEVFTLWVAINDVTADMGPMCMLRGSNQWGFHKDIGDFFDSDIEKHLEQIRGLGAGPIDEVPILLNAGGASLHARLTYHGSAANTSTQPRRSFAIHLRTERSRVLPGAEDSEYVRDLGDLERCPIIYSA